MGRDALAPIDGLIGEGSAAGGNGVAELIERADGNGDVRRLVAEGVGEIGGGDLVWFRSPTLSWLPAHPIS